MFFCFERTGTDPHADAWHPLPSYILECFFVFGNSLIDFATIEDFQLLIPGTGSLLDIVHGTTQYIRCAATDGNSKPTLLILMLFGTMIHIVFTGNVYILASQRNIFPGDNIRGIHMYVFIRFDGHITSNATNSRTLLRNVFIFILIISLFTADGET